MDATERFHAHVECCEQCRQNLFGLCARGFALLGAVAGMRSDDRQEELPLDLGGLQQRPFVRMFMNGQYVQRHD